MFTKLVRHQLVEKDLKVSDLARLLNTSYQNLDQKLKQNTLIGEFSYCINKLIGVQYTYKVKQNRPKKQPRSPKSTHKLKAIYW